MKELCKFYSYSLDCNSSLCYVNDVLQVKAPLILITKQQNNKTVTKAIFISKRALAF